MRTIALFLALATFLVKCHATTVVVDLATDDEVREMRDVTADSEMRDVTASVMNN